MIYRQKQKFKNNTAFCLFSQNFGPFYAGPNFFTLQKLTPLSAGVIKANKVYNNKTRSGMFDNLKMRFCMFKEVLIYLNTFNEGLVRLTILRSSHLELHQKRISLKNILKSVCKWIHSSKRTRLLKLISAREVFGEYYQQHNNVFKTFPNTLHKQNARKGLRACFSDKK